MAAIGCPLCQIVCRTTSARDCHIRNVHPAATVAQLGANWTPCTVCGQLFSSSNGMMRHRRSVRDDAHAAARQPVAQVAVEDGAAGNAPVPNPPDDGADALAEIIPLPIAPAEFPDLLSFFRMPLYHLDGKDAVKFLQVSTILLEQAGLTAAAMQETAESSTLAVLLLPGMVQFLRGRTGPFGTQSSLLDAILGVPNKANYIIRKAYVWRVSILDRGPPRNAPASSVASTCHRVEQLTRDWRYSAAATTVAQLSDLQLGHPIPDRLSIAAAKEKIAQLHPPANENDVLPEPTADPPAGELEITAEIVRRHIEGHPEEAIPCLSTDSAQGSDGWTNKLIRQLSAMCKDRQDHLVHAQGAIAFHANLARLYVNMYSNKIKGVAQTLWTTVRSVLLPKPDGGLRPIGISGALYRLAARIGAHYVLARTKDQLEPLQLGAGLRGGCEIGAQIAQVTYDRDDCNLSLDLSNAYNETRHRPIYDGLCKYGAGKELLGFFRFAYDCSVELRGQGGALYGRTETGVRQGDPLSALFFMVAFQPILEEVDVLVNQVGNQIRTENGLAEEPPGTNRTLAFFDDAQVHGKYETIFRATPAIIDAVERGGYRVNRTKSKAFGRDADIMADPPMGITICTEAVVLGAPIGEESYRKTWLSSRLQGALPSLEALPLLSPKTAVKLLVKCFNSRAVYHARVNEPAVIADSLTAFDIGIDMAIATVLRADSTCPIFKTVRSTPLRMGGMGTMRHAGATHDRQVYHSRSNTARFLSQHNAKFGTMLSLFNPTFESIVIGQSEGFGAETTGLTDEVLSEARARVSVEPKAMEKVTMRGVYRVLEHKLDNLIAELADQVQNQPQAAWLLSLKNARTPFNFIFPPAHLDDMIPAAEFVDALRLHLGVPALQDPLGRDHVCTCSRHPRLSAEPFHLLDCLRVNSYRVANHNKIVGLLKTYLRKLYPAGRFELEPYLGRDGTQNRSGDLLVEMAPGVSYIIDVSIVNPAGKTQVDRNKTHQEQDAAARSREVEKRALYARVLTEAGGHIDAERIVPFVIERTGRLGPAALSFLEAACMTNGGRTFQRSQFLKELSFWTAFYNGRIMGVARGYLDIVPAGDQAV